MICRRAGFFAGHQAGAGGRADGVGRIGVGELHAGGGDGVDGGGLVEGGAVVADLVPGEVVGEEEDDVPGAGGVGGGAVSRPGAGVQAVRARRRRESAAMPTAVLWVRGSSDPPAGEAAERRSPEDKVAGFAGRRFCRRLRRLAGQKTRAPRDRAVADGGVLYATEGSSPCHLLTPRFAFGLSSQHRSDCGRPPGPGTGNSPPRRRRTARCGCRRRACSCAACSSAGRGRAGCAARRRG